MNDENYWANVKEHLIAHLKILPTYNGRIMTSILNIFIHRLSIIKSKTSMTMNNKSKTSVIPQARKL